MRAATSGRRARAEALCRRPEIATTRGRGSCAARAGTATPTSPAARTAGRRCSTSASRLRVASTSPASCSPAAPTRTSRSRNEYGEMPRALRRRRRRPRPRAHARAARGGREPRRRRVASTTPPRPRDPECLRALLEHGATRRADPRSRTRSTTSARSTSRLLLDAGADARELLPHAVRRGRGPEYLRLLVEHGADLEHRGGEGWRKPERLRTAYQHAVLRDARRRRAQLLAELGARDRTSTPTTSRSPRSPAASARPRSRATLDYDQQEVLILAALRGAGGARVELVRPGLPRASSAARPKASLLHHAAWFGDAARRATRCSRRAPTRSRASGRHWPPRCTRQATRTAITSAWPSGSSPPAASIEPWMLEQADGPLADWLRWHQRGDGESSRSAAARYAT